MSKFRVRRRSALALMAALTPVVVACGSTATMPSKVKPTTAAKASNGVPIPRAPARIVSLSPSATDDLFAVGAGRQVVAADRYSTYPANAPHTNLSGFSPNIEAIATYNPDLVVTDADANRLGSRLAKLHIPLLLEPAPANVAEMYTQLAQLGAVTGHARGAAGVIATMRAQIAAIIRSVPRPKTPLTVYHELDQTLFSASSHTFVGQLYALLGLRNIADKSPSSTGYPQLSAEYVISSSPSVIVLADTVCCHQSPATVAARPGWRNIAAVRTGTIVPVDDSVASQWGPRIVDFLATVAQAVRTLEPRR
jgi:iron complex transport system substrate-binding protein